MNEEFYHRKQTVIFLAAQATTFQTQNEPILSNFYRSALFIKQVQKLQNWAPSTCSIASDQTSLLKLATACLFNNKISRSYITETKKLRSHLVWVSNSKLLLTKNCSTSKNGMRTLLPPLSF